MQQHHCANLLAALASLTLYPFPESHGLMQVQLQSMYESYYAAHPSTRTPPIPTANVHLSHPPQREAELCYWADTTEQERDAAKTALLDAVFELEKALTPEHPVRQMVSASSASWMGKYVIKREYAELSHHLTFLNLPELGPHRCNNPDLAAEEAMDPPTQSSGDSPAKNGSWVYAGLQISAEVNSMLTKAADRVLQHSCGEGWLVQPHIANMSGLEYRVYLLGGASAVSALDPALQLSQPPCTAMQSDAALLLVTIIFGALL